MEKAQKPGSAILIVDDNPKNLEVLGKLLQVEKYEIEFATNGEAALDWLSNRQFDLILLDINMPGMNGFEVCRKIRSDPQMNNIPVIFLSAESERESILKGFEMGAQDYVTKPFDSRELIMRVKTHLLLKKSREELEEINTSLEEKVRERTLQLNEAKERAEASDRLKTAFMNNISHEVRTPLNGILGFAQIVIQPGITEERKKHYLDILQESGERLLNTITNYMDISLIVSDNQDVKKGIVFVDTFLNEVCEKFEQPCAKKGITLTCEIPSLAEKLQIFSDRTLLIKIINHLMNNALKFTKEGDITIGYAVKESKVEFYVKDTGVGISAEAHKQVFDYFIQEDSSNTRGHEGNGLGLSISRGLVTLLGGKIGCESEKGKGSRFYFTIPFQEATCKPYNDTVIENDHKANDKPVILIAEDDENSYLYLEEIFISSSIEVIHAINGAEAVEICRNNSTINLVLMDLKMPVLNGFDATRQIKSFNKNIPVIAITAYAMSGDETRAREAGCDDYIPKPIDLKELEKKIYKHFPGEKLKLSV